MGYLGRPSAETNADERILARLESALSAERTALVSRDWDALREATLEKDELVAALAELSRPLAEPLSQRLRALRHTADHNGRLASRLSGQVAQWATSARGGRYGRHARLQVVQRAALHVVG